MDYTFYLSLNTPENCFRQISNMSRNTENVGDKNIVFSRSADNVWDFIVLDISFLPRAGPKLHDQC